ncbi:MAG: PRD domain-containing protein [Clostridiaceae bacterium]|nr:PRD domain-containing protein [Clostridiaceae bacterium]
MNTGITDFKVIKVFNNNIVLISQDNKEKILFEKGIGFGKHLGDIISKNTKIEKVFSMEDKTNSNNFNELINSLDKSIIALCEEVIYMISKELKEDLNEKVHISLTDHIAFTIKRLKNGEDIKNPFLVEIQTLYPREFEVAQKAVTMISARTNVYFPDDEVGFITLHIHSARNEGKLSNTVKYAFLSNTIINLIEDELNIQIDKKSLDYARFITHIRFAIQRITNGTPIQNDLLGMIKQRYSRAFKLSEKIARLLESELNLKVVEDETAYLATHIQRFKSLGHK